MVRKFIMGFCVSFLIASGVANAQPKPKRDTSKDRSVVEAKKKQEQAKKAASQKGKQGNAWAHKKQQDNTTPTHATYLYVDQQTSLTLSFNSYSCNETFNVSTDGKEWHITQLPSWCRVSKNRDSFILSVDANPMHDERSSWFKIISDTQEVRINLSQSGKPLNISAEFKYARLYHNVNSNTETFSSAKYLRINTSVSIKGAVGQKCHIIAFISDEKDYGVKASLGYTNHAFPYSYNVYAASEVTPTSDEEQSFNVDIYLPNNSMNLPKRRNKLRCHLALYCDKTDKYIIGADYSIDFTAINKKGNVTTKWR